MRTRYAAVFPSALIRAVAGAVFVLLAWMQVPASAQGPVLSRFLDKVPAGELVAGADAYDALRADLPVVPIMKAGRVSCSRRTSRRRRMAGHTRRGP